MWNLWKLLLNAMLMGLVVAAVSEIARRFPRVGSLVLTMPIVIPAVFVVMYLRDRNLQPIARMARDVLILIPLALPFFLPMAFAHRLGLGFWPALATGLLLVTATVGVYLVFAPKM
ncbi:MAG: hypothetical protein ACHRHE_15095 [Tepidisphaerales bacterium]